MPTGKQGAPEGLAKAFVDYVRTEAATKGWSLDVIAGYLGKSKGYVAPRMREEAIFTLQDLENYAIATDLEPQELLARVQFPPARGYNGRLVPTYGATGDSRGLTIYRAVDADPSPAEDNVITGRFGAHVGDAGQDLAEVASDIAHPEHDTDDQYDT